MGTCNHDQISKTTTGCTVTYAKSVHRQAISAHRKIVALSRLSNPNIKHGAWSPRLLVAADNMVHDAPRRQCPRHRAIKPMPID